MFRTRTLPALALVPVLALPLALAGIGPSDPSTLRYGPEIPLGNGVARTYLVLAEDGSPVELGVALSEAALDGLPTLEDRPPLEAYLQMDLEFPEGTPEPWRHALLDWNPRGHPPVDIYGLPHFDFHFYTIDSPGRLAMDPADPAFGEKGARAPAPEFVPAGYLVPPEATVPQMGTHWIDASAHELHGQTFTRTFLYGSWDGRLVFLEPMITKAHLETRPDVTIPIATPERYQLAGWYPSSYRIAFDQEASEYRVALTDFRQVAEGIATD